MMGSVFLLLFWKKAKSNVLEYVVPIWEVTGTFGAFWVVSGYFAYPSLLIPVASIFAPLLIVFLILFVARNASIAFGEFIIKRKWLDEVKLYRTYAISTLVLGLAVLVLLSSLVSGAGIDLTKETFSLGAWVSSPGSLLFVIGTLVIVSGVAPVFYSLIPMREIVLPATTSGIALSVLSYYLYSPSLVSAWMLIPVALTLIPGVLFISGKTASIVSNKAILIALLGATIFSLQFLVYPSVVGGAISVDAVTTSGPMASAYLTITAVGGVILAIMLGLYMNVTMHSKNSTKVEIASATA